MFKKLMSALSVTVAMLMMTVSAFAEEVIGASSPVVGDSSGSTNVPTGVTIDWIPIAICGGVLAVAIIVFVVMSIMKKKKK